MESILLAVVAALLSAVSVLFGLLHRDITRRLSRLERKASTELMVLVILLGRMPDVPPDLLRTIQAAIADTE